VCVTSAGASTCAIAGVRRFALGRRGEPTGDLRLDFFAAGAAAGGISGAGPGSGAATAGCVSSTAAAAAGSDAGARRRRADFRALVFFAFDRLPAGLRFVVAIWSSAFETLAAAV
jgi:hypothetical protein